MLFKILCSLGIHIKIKSIKIEGETIYRECFCGKQNDIKKNNQTIPPRVIR